MRPGLDGAQDTAGRPERGVSVLIAVQILLALGGLITTHITLSAPFCVLQLALLRYSTSQVIKLAPAAASAIGLLCGLWILEWSSGWESLLALFVLVPSWLGLVGCGLGWLIWRLARKHLW